jgi:hypothetical protein
LCNGKEGYCYENICSPTKRVINTSCKQNSDCQSNFCESYYYEDGSSAGGICK